MKKVVLAAALAAAILVPAASAKHAPRVKLALLPLPASAIGPAATLLPLQPGSGATANSQAARRGQFLTPTHSVAAAPASAFASLGRISGYVLDYGLGAGGGSGVTEVWTSVDRYETRLHANTGLAFWKSADRRVGQFSHGGLAVSGKTEAVESVGTRRFAYLVGFSAGNFDPVFGLDEQFVEGRYEAEVMVWAGTAAAAEKLGPTLAKKLDTRIREALAGRLHARPVKLPAKQKAGPPSGGPDLGALALKTSDLTGPATLLGPFYLDDFFNPTALSVLNVPMNPAGRFDQLVQVLEWCPTANQASFLADFRAAATLSGSGVAQLDLGNLGDGARGFIENSSSGGAARLLFSSGRLVESIDVSSVNGVQAPDVQKLARTAASYIDAAGL